MAVNLQFVALSIERSLRTSPQAGVAIPWILGQFLMVFPSNQGIATSLRSSQLHIEREPMIPY